MVFFAAAFVFSIVGVDGQGRSKSPFNSWETTLTKPGKGKSFNHTPVSRDTHMHHGLAKFFFSVKGVHLVGLVDNINKMHKLGGSPEYAAKTRCYFKIVIVIEKFSKAQITMASFFVLAVLAIKSFEGETEIVLKIVIEFYISCNGRRLIFLSLPGRITEKKESFKGKIATKFNGLTRLLNTERAAAKKREQKNNCRSSVYRYHRIRFKLVELKSPSVSPVLNL